MAKELKLGWNELLVYGVIYSSVNQTYTWGQETLATYVWAWRITVVRALQKLLENGLIEKVSKWYKIVSNWYTNVSEWYNQEMYQNDTEMYQNETKNVSNWYTYNKQDKNNNKKKKIKKEKNWTNPSVDEIVEWFVEHTWIENEQAIHSITTRLEHKQDSKEPYTSVRWAITQLQKILWLLGDKDRVKKLEFCVNNSIANNRQGLGWYESSEKEFYAWLKQEQKIKKQKEQQDTEWMTYWVDTIDSIINQVVEQQVKQGIIQKF